LKENPAAEEKIVLLSLLLAPVFASEKVGDLPHGMTSVLIPLTSSPHRQLGFHAIQPDLLIQLLLSPLAKDSQ
jgi:hypothetical protein